MKYICIYEKNGDMFTDEFEALSEAKECADRQYAHMTSLEKKTCTLSVLESANPDEDAEDHFDGKTVYAL